MNKKLGAQTSQFITIFLLLLLLACGPLDQLQDLNRKGRALATGVAVIDEGDFLAFEAYENLQRLPGYRLESRNILRDESGNLLTFQTVSQIDSQGNAYIVTQTPDGQQQEIYVVEGHTYVFDPQYEGWVDLGAIAPANIPQTGDRSPVDFNQPERMMQLLPQIGAVPTEAGRETIQNRSVTRYELDYVTAELAEAFGNHIDTALDLYGTLWIDDQTGALLRSEVLIFRDGTRQPHQELVLETTDIGNIDPIILPFTVVDTNAIISATATAQAWSMLPAKINYQGQAITFELVPIRAGQTSQQAGLAVDLQLVLNQLPAELSLDTDVKPFLTQLQHQLTLSLPKHNKVVASNGFRVEDIDPEHRSIEVVYQFKANLQDFDYVELIVAGAGNPQFAPVPVVNKE